MVRATFVGGKLSLKGEKKKKSKKSVRKKKSSQASKHSLELAAKENDTLIQESIHLADDDLTEAERKSLKRKQERERIDLEKLAEQSHRERVEDFNEKLGRLTELNDIPRISAAGNG